MPATEKYIPNSRPEPSLQKNNQIHKSGFHLHPHLPARRILSKKILPGGSISFLLGTLSSLYDLSAPNIIEVSAEVIGDYVAWEDLQAFEHAEFEKELAQEIKQKKEYEEPELPRLMGETVERVRGQPMKIKGNIFGTVSYKMRKPTSIMGGLGIESSKSQSPASSTENHGEMVRRVGEPARKSRQDPSQPQSQAQPHKETRQSLEQFLRRDGDNEDDLIPQHQRHGKRSRRIIYSSDDEDEYEIEDSDDDDAPLQSQFHGKPSLPLYDSRDPDDNDGDHDDNDGKNAEVLLRNFQQTHPKRPLPPKQAPTLHKFLIPSSTKPLNSNSPRHLPNHTRSTLGPFAKRAELSTSSTKIVRKPPLSLKKTLHTPRRSPSMTSPFPGTRPAVKKTRFEI